MGPLRWLSENSYFYSLIMNAVWGMAKSALLSEKRAEMFAELTVATRTPDQYQKQLTAQLIERMYRFCRNNGLIFITLDIPQPDELRGFKSSIPVDLVDDFKRSSDVLIRSEELLSRYRHVAEFHVAHGQHHISELTHTLVGCRGGRTIRDLLLDPTRGTVPPLDTPRTTRFQASGVAPR